MKFVGACLLAICCFLLYDIWFGRNGVEQYEETAQALQLAKIRVDKLTRINEGIRDEIVDLQQGNLAVEDRARSELGMIKPEETFYRVIDTQN